MKEIVTHPRVLNDANRGQVQTLVTKAMANNRLLAATEDELRNLRASVRHNEAVQQEAERERKRYNRELKELGFHDVGHARTELETP